MNEIPCYCKLIACSVQAEERAEVSKAADNSRQNLRATLRAAGLRATPARVAVLGALREAEAPLSHAEVADLVDDAGCDRTTVFRNLVALAETGLLRRLDCGDRTWRFEVAGDEEKGDHTHPHFLCTECGSVQCVDGVELTLARRRLLPRSIRNGAVEIQLRGVCDRCD